MSNKYILLLDEDEDILNIQKMGLSHFYGGDIHLAKNGEQGLEILLKFGNPELIISDHKILEAKSGKALYPHLNQNNIPVPLIICSGSLAFEFNEKKHPMVSAFIQKPFNLDALTYLVKSITTTELIQQTHIPVDLDIIRRFGMARFDLFIRLSDRNIIKVINRGEVVSDEEFARFKSKGIDQLHVTVEDCSELIKTYEATFSLLKSTSTEDELALFALEGVEFIEEFSRKLGWTPEAVSKAQENVALAVEVLSKSQPIEKILRQRFKKPTRSFKRHIGLLTYLSCMFSNDLEVSGPPTQMKLAMAAIMHDVFVDERYYLNIKGWNKRAADYRDKDPETVKYRLHPLEASRLVQGLDRLPPEVDQIILQHHELSHGGGFPRSLTANRISFLATLFIMVEEMVEFVGDGENLETSVKDYLTWGDHCYQIGNFKKIFGAIRPRLEKF